MNRPPLNRLFRITAACCLVAFLTLAVAPPASAQVSDNAGFFSANGLVQAQQIINDIRSRTGKRVVVNTYQNVPPDQQASYNQLGKDKFYEEMVTQIGRQQGADVVVIVTRNPGHIEVGANQATRAREFPPADHRQASQMMANSFRGQQYDQGLVQTLQYIQGRLSQNAGTGAMQQTAPPSVPRSSGGGGGMTGYPSSNAPPPTATPARRGVCGGLGTGGICLIIAVVGIFLLARKMMGAGRRMVGGGGGYPMGGQQGYPPGGAGYGQPGYGQPGYGPPPPQGGGFGRGMLGGLLGGVLGGAAYDQLRGGHGGSAQAAPPPAGGGGGYAPPAASDDVSSGADFGPSSGGADFGGSSFDSGGGGADFGGGGGDVGGGGGDVSSGSDF